MCGRMSTVQAYTMNGYLCPKSPRSLAQTKQQERSGILHQPICWSSQPLIPTINIYWVSTLGYLFACNILTDVVSAAVSKDGPPKNQTSWYCYLRGTLPNWVKTSLLLALPKRMWQGVPVLGLALKRTAGFNFFPLGTFGSPKLLSNKSGYCAGRTHPEWRVLRLHGEAPEPSFPPEPPEDSRDPKQGHQTFPTQPSPPKEQWQIIKLFFLRH